MKLQQKLGQEIATTTSTIQTRLPRRSLVFNQGPLKPLARELRYLKPASPIKSPRQADQ